jgi:hypothetical protein
LLVFIILFLKCQLPKKLKVNQYVPRVLGEEVNLCVPRVLEEEINLCVPRVLEEEVNL